MNIDHYLLRLAPARLIARTLLASVICLVTSGYAAGQEKIGAAKPPFARNAPSAVAPTPAMLATAGVIALSLVTAAGIVHVLRTSRSRGIPTVLPVSSPRRPADIPVVILVGPAENARFDGADELPPIPAGPTSTFAGENLVRTEIATLEKLAHGLRSARHNGGAGRTLYQRLQPMFVVTDERGSCWTVGTQTFTWYRAEDGNWVARMPPVCASLNDSLYRKLVDLEAAFPPARGHRSRDAR